MGKNDAEPRTQLVRFMAEVHQIAENSVTDRTLVHFGAFRRFRDWSRQSQLLRRKPAFEWRNGMTVRDVMWLFNENKKKAA